jgi:hypothetical protein
MFDDISTSVTTHLKSEPEPREYRFDVASIINQKNAAWVTGTFC